MTKKDKAGKNNVFLGKRLLHLRENLGCITKNDKADENVVFLGKKPLYPREKLKRNVKTKLKDQEIVSLEKYHYIHKRHSYAKQKRQGQCYFCKRIDKLKQ